MTEAGEKYYMQRTYGHMQPTRQRTAISQRGQKGIKYGHDDGAVLASGWSHVPGYIDVDRNSGFKGLGRQL